MAHINREELLSGKAVGIHQLEEPLVGYKKIACLKSDLTYHAVAVLEIPRGAFVVRGNGLMDSDERRVPSVKLRADCVIVKEIIHNIASPCEFVSLYDPDYIYCIGKKHRPKFDFGLSLDGPCHSGIHFFLTRKEADDFLLR